MILCAAQRVFWFTALGFLTVVLIGPVLSILGTILPFALLGALVWLAWSGARRLTERFRPSVVREKLVPNRVLSAVSHGARRVFQEGVRQCKDFGPVVLERVWQAGSGAERMLRQGMQQCREAGPALREQGRRMEGKVVAWTRAVARMVVEGTCGAVVGGLVAWYAVDPTAESVAIGALVGAALGFVVGGTKQESARKLAAE
jgi:hypothetical protein